MSAGNLGSAAFIFQGQDAEFQAVAARVERTVLALQQKLSTSISGLFSGLNLPKIIPELDTSKITAGIEGLLAKLKVAPIALSVDTAALTTAVENIAKLLTRVLRVPVVADTTQVLPAVERVKAVAERIPIALKVQPDVRAARAELANLTAGRLPAVVQERILRLKTEGAERTEAQVKGVLDRTRDRIDRLSKFASRAFLGGGVAIAFALRQASNAAGASARLDAALRATGNAAGFTGDQLRGMATQLERTTTFEDDAIVAGQALLATFKNISGQQFAGAIRAATDLSVVLGQDLQTSVLQVGKALDEPGEGLAALSRAGVRFSQTQKQMIDAAVASGNIIGAQNLILQRLASTMGGTAQAAAQTFGGRVLQLRNALSNLAETLGNALIPSITTFVNQLQRTIPQIQNWIQANQATVVSVVKWGAVLAGTLIIVPKLVAGIGALATVLGVMGKAVLLLGGPITALILTLGAFIAVLVRARVTGESFTESAYQTTRALGLWRTATQNVGNAMAELGKASTAVKQAQLDLANARTLDEQAAAADRLSQALKRNAELERELTAAAQGRKDLDVGASTKRAAALEQQARDAEALADRFRQTSAATAVGSANAAQLSADRQREIQQTLKEIYRAQLTDRERAAADFEVQLAKEVDALKAHGEQVIAIENFAFARRREFQAQQNKGIQSDLERRNEVIRSANELLMGDEDRAESQFESILAGHVQQLREWGQSESQIFAFIQQARAKFAADQTDVVLEGLIAEDDKRRDFLDRLALVGVDAREQRRLQLEQQRDDLIRQAENLGEGQDRILEIRRRFAQEMDDIDKETTRRSGQMVGLIDVFNRLQESAVNAADDADRRRRDQQAQQPPPPQQPPRQPQQTPLPVPPDQETLGLSRQQLQKQTEIAQATTATKSLAEQTLAEMRRIASLPATFA